MKVFLKLNGLELFPNNDFKLPTGCSIIQNDEQAIHLKKSNIDFHIWVNTSKSYYSNKEFYYIKGQINIDTKLYDTFDLNYVSYYEQNKFQTFLNHINYFGEDNGLHTPSYVIEKLFGDMHWSGLSGTIKKYFKFPCVVGYAANLNCCVMIIKMRKSGYKAIEWSLANRWNNYVYEEHLKDALNKMQNIRENVPKYLEFDEQTKIDLVTRCI